MNFIEQEMRDIVANILEDYNKEGNRAIDQMGDIANRVDQELIIDIINKMFRIIFPGYYKERSYRIYNMEGSLTVLMEDVMYNLNKQINIVMKLLPEYKEKAYEEIDETAQKICLQFFRQIPKVREYIETDVQALFDGDPAAPNKDVIILCYPGLIASTIYRIAHELYLLNVPMIPRIMTEYAHRQTGIDIHPGATIGKYFFIDHGTVIVIGETTTIGDNVKIYQGVTLGALSTRGGQKLRNKKRHPTLGNNVTVYAGASILGGDSVIGDGATIGSNVFITNSVPAGATIINEAPKLRVKI